MARTRVEGTGLNKVPWRKEARSALVALDRRALEACFATETEDGAVVVMDGLGGGGAKGMCHKPFGVLGPFIIMLPFLIICTLNLVKRAAHSSSQSLPMEMREPVDRPLRTCPVEAVVESFEERGTWTDLVAFIRRPLAAATWGPKGVER